MTSKNWYLDGALISQGSMDYTWSITAGGHTTSFTGSNANGSVSQQWDINGGLGGNVAGTSTHVNLTPIPNAVVSLYIQAGTLYDFTQSGADGTFQFNNVPIGSYYVNVTKDGFFSNRSSNFTVAANSTVNAGNVTMVNWDINGDGEVNVLDMYSVIHDGLYLNNDGKVDAADVFMVSEHMDTFL